MSGPICPPAVVRGERGTVGRCALPGGRRTLAAAGAAFLLVTLAAGRDLRISEPFPGVTVAYEAADTEAAVLAATQVRDALGRVAAMLGARGQREARVTVRLAVMADGGDMAGVLGPRYGFNTLGAYWRGVILVLSPRAWLDTADPAWRERFLREGPVVHELAHLVLDRVTLGRVPPWLDEGVAQYVEYALTGYEWTEGDAATLPVHSLTQLSRSFRALPDEATAYREAFLFVRFLVERSGEGALADLARRLRRGEDGLAAAAAVARLETDGLETAWRHWLRQRWADAPAAAGDGEGEEAGADFPAGKGRGVAKKGF